MSVDRCRRLFDLTQSTSGFAMECATEHNHGKHSAFLSYMKGLSMWTPEQAARWRAEKIETICATALEKCHAIENQYQSFLERLSQQRQQLETITVTTHDVR